MATRTVVAWYRDPLTWLALALVSPAFIWAVGSVFGWKRLLEVEGTTWAAWVQALGSVLAIVVSTAIINWQVRRQYSLQMQTERRHELRAEFVFINSVVQVNAIAEAKVLEAAAAMVGVAAASNYIRTERQAQRLDLIDRVLQDTDHTKLGSPVYQLAFLQTTAAFSAARSHLDRLIDDPGFVNSRSVEQTAALLAKQLIDLRRGAEQLSSYCDDVRLSVARQEQDDRSA